MAVPNLESFRKSLKGTPMYSEAAAIYDVAMRNGVNPAFVSGLAKAESSYGTAGFARGRKNPYGYGVFSGGPNNGYGSYADATEAMTKGLRGNLYYGAGKRSIADVMNTYSPPSSNNTGQHIQNIINAGRATGGDASQVFLDGPTGYEGTAGDDNTAAAKKALSPSGSGDPMQQAIAQSITSGDDEDDEKESLFNTVMNVAMKQAMQGQTEPQSDGHEGHDHGDGGGGVGILANDGTQPGLSKWGGPHDHGKRALGNWQSDTAWDLGGPAGTAIYSPLPGRVVKVSDWDDRAQFRGQGVTIDHGNGNLAFYKHLGNVAVKPGQQVGPGTLLGGLADGTGGGPHLHLGGSSNSFLESLIGYYLR